MSNLLQGDCTVKAFYFAADDKRLRYGDGRQIRVGRTHKVKDKIKLCDKGLHASERLLDALYNAPRNHLYLVELSGNMDVGHDKIAASERKYLAYFNAEKLLREFARKQALINVEKIKPYCSDEDYGLINIWLITGAKTLQKAAVSAVRTAAESAVRSAIRSAAKPALRAAESAAWVAEASAAWAAAESSAFAAKSAAESAALAAESEVWTAALAAKSAANDMLTAMVREATGWEI